MALLFVANATLKPRGPLFTNNSEGLPRSEPARTQQAQRAPEAPRPRAPAPVQTASREPAKPAAPHIAEIAEAVEAPPLATSAAIEVAKPEAAETVAAKPDVPVTESAKTEPSRTEPSNTEPAKTEPAKIETAALETAATEPAKSETVGREAVTVAPKAVQRQTLRTAKRKTHKSLARKNERAGRYTNRDNDFSQDDAPAFENGYAYGVARRRQRSEWQRPWGGDFDENRYRF
ncbi:hypothetical protein [Rhodoplanes sp. Z2-YC6860]|uniref:hypothetical protein n=1 Tax=Rhodoplanes sp. Z2-YC6860 TaxID=674703 RepID=UPI0012ECE25C|nr:hypothetical protein [Rhodoplanes sp. Z2-YC6860]